MSFYSLNPIVAPYAYAYGYPVSTHELYDRKEVEELCNQYVYLQLDCFVEYCLYCAKPCIGFNHTECFVKK